MASANPPVKGVAFAFETALIAQADTDIFKAGPTLAAGDVLVIKDGVLAGNITSLPAAVASCTNLITVSLSAAEMNADRITVLFHDAAGDEWQDQEIMIFTSAQTFDATDIIADDVKATVNHVTYGNSALATGIAAIPTTAAPSASDNATAAAAAILATPDNKLATDASGRVTIGTISDKTGYKLAADGLDSISTVAPAGVASTWPAKMLQLWYRFFGKVTMTTTQLKTYADSDGTTVVTTQTVSDDGVVQTQGKAT